MPAICCPYCGEVANLPLKFCVSCGRAIPAGEKKKMGGLKASIKQPGITKRLDDSPSASTFDLSKRSYRIQRALRRFLIQMCYVALSLLLFYCAIRLAMGLMRQYETTADDSRVNAPLVPDDNRQTRKMAPPARAPGRTATLKPKAGKQPAAKSTTGKARAP